MKQAVDIFENAILHWRDNGGKGTALIPYPINDKIMVLGVLQRIYARSPTCKIIIVTNNFQERQDFITYLTNQGDEANDAEFKTLINNGNLKIFTFDYIVKKNNSGAFCCIIYHPESAHFGIISFMNQCKFKLVIINKLFKDANDSNSYYKICPLLDDFKATEVEELRLSSPVEEMQIGVTIDKDSEDFKLLAKYNEYITTSISIFGSFDIIQQARKGNTSLNVSANQICAQIAQENGWNEHLDMNIEFNVQIDNLYNPMNLKQRASDTYEMIRRRSQLLSDNNSKLDAILEIINNNQDKKILIINKRGEFASIVTDYINNMSETNICGNYHDKVDKIPMIDDCGCVVYYKSGVKKGEPRYMAADAQKSRNELLFNNNKLNVLSTSNAPDKDLCINVDIIIITSTQCESIKSYMYRLNKIRFNNNKLTLYTIFCKDTLEQRLLESKELANNHTITNNCENNVIIENNSDFIIVD